MKIKLKIDVPIQISDSVTDITFSDSVMVSLDCSGCSRCNRSVVVSEFDYLSYCMPTKHRFNGKILKCSSSKSEVSNTVTGHYLIEYEFTDFEDSKYPDRVPKKGSNWARVRFTMRCKCGVNVTYETQNNNVRPFEILCECGTMLATETEEIPVIYH